MRTTFLQRSIIIFTILLCCLQFWASAQRVNCELYPFHKSCRGVMTRKRAVPPDFLRTLECNEGDCRLPKLKFLIALLDDNLNNKDDGYDFYSSGYDAHKKRKTRYDNRRPTMENMMNMALDNMESDY